METRGEKSQGGQEVARAGDSSSIADCTLKEKPAPEGQSKDYGPEDLGQSSIGCFERQCNPVEKPWALKLSAQVEIWAHLQVTHPGPGLVTVLLYACFLLHKMETVIVLAYKVAVRTE